MRRECQAWMQLLLWLAVPACLKADGYALVAGVGQFPYYVNANGQPAINLDGPRPDAEQMVAELTRYGFDPRNMIVLLDTKATRDAILDGIDQLASRVKEGDQVVIYYSGHGTSSLDKDTGGFGMDAATGAVVPSDIRPGGKDAILAQLIVGKRDLRPRLERLEQKASVLVIFDACFSGESVKSVMLPGDSSLRYVSLADLTAGAVSSRSLIAAEQARARGAVDYPYRRVVYLSAAANNQYAYDITRAMLTALQGRFSTVDGQPHGAFTNVLATLWSDGSASKGSCRELFDRLAGMVHDQSKIIEHSQDPQLLYSPANAGEIERPCLPSPAAVTPPPAGGPQTGIRAELDKVASQAAFHIQCESSQPFYRPGEKTVLRCTAPDKGYFQVYSYGMGDPQALVLLPNRYQSDTSGGPGVVQIPGGRFDITNDLPEGAARQEQVMLVLFTRTPQDPRSLGVPEGIFTGIAERAFRSQRITPANAYGAAELVFEIRR